MILVVDSLWKGKIMPRQPAVSEDATLRKWQRYIDAEIPPIENTPDERNLLRFRRRAVQAPERPTVFGHVLPINPVRYEGRMSDWEEFAFEHFS